MYRVTLTVALLVSCSIANSVIVRYYNEVRHKELEFAEFQKEYLTHEGHRTNTNLFVGVATPECKDQLESPAFKGSQRHAGGDVLSVVTLSASDFPLPLNSCVEVFFYPINTPISDPKERTGKYVPSPFLFRRLSVCLTDWPTVKLTNCLNACLPACLTIYLPD